MSICPVGPGARNRAKQESEYLELKMIVTFIGAFPEHLLEDLQPGGVVINNKHTQAGRKQVVPWGSEASLHL